MEVSRVVFDIRQATVFQGLIRAIRFLRLIWSLHVFKLFLADNKKVMMTTLSYVRVSKYIHIAVHVFVYVEQCCPLVSCSLIMIFGL